MRCYTEGIFQILKQAEETTQRIRSFSSIVIVHTLRQFASLESEHPSMKSPTHFVAHGGTKPKGS